jgi:hypothetical protein
MMLVLSATGAPVALVNRVVVMMLSSVDITLHPFAPERLASGIIHPPARMQLLPV